MLTQLCNNNSCQSVIKQTERQEKCLKSRKKISKKQSKKHEQLNQRSKLLSFAAMQLPTRRPAQTMKSSFTKSVVKSSPNAIVKQQRFVTTSAQVSERTS